MSTPPPTSHTEVAAETGGYNHTLTDPTHDYDCGLCGRVVRQPVKTPCGHSFCGSCWTAHVGSSGKKTTCPVDKGEVDMSRVLNDDVMMKRVGELKVRCDNRQHGCQYVGQLVDIQEHLSQCKYRMVPCDQECGQVIRCTSLAYHKRDVCERRNVQCPLCHVVMAAKDETAHDDHCPKMFTRCKWCHEHVTREDVESHVLVCPDYLTFCRFALHGCSAKVIRRELPSHHEQNVHRHLEYLSAAVEGVGDDVGVGGARRSVGQSDQSLSYELPVDLWPKVHAAMASGGYGYNGRDLSLIDRVLCLESNNATLENRLSEMDHNHKKAFDAMKTEFTKAMEMSEKRMDAVLTKHDNAIANHTREKSELEREVQRLASVVIGMRSPINSASSRGGVGCGVDGSNSVEDKYDIVPKEPVELKRGGRNVCPILWQMELKDGVNEYSPSFYTAAGYKMYLRVGCLNDGSKREFAVWCCLMKGERDADLLWPYDGPEVMRVQVKGGTERSKTKFVSRTCTVASVGCAARERLTDTYRHDNDSAVFFDYGLPYHEGMTVNIIVRTFE